MFSCFVETELGLFGASGDEWGRSRIYLPHEAQEAADRPSEGPLPWDFPGQLMEYLAGKRKEWNLPFSLTGSPFQLAVWYACKDIPYGSACTYGQLAAMAGYSGAAQSVGRAMAANPLPLVIPCHRVLPASGGIGCYGGGADLKEKLLRLEGVLETE